ncbi:hypothetical protein TV39_14970 [Arthrobacter sp. SPG23]|nr:hypothetical protein TV39_14970 [Arthrobacter sp. SPG23]
MRRRPVRRPRPAAAVPSQAGAGREQAWRAGARPGHPKRRRRKAWRQPTGRQSGTTFRGDLRSRPGKGRRYRRRSRSVPPPLRGLPRF